jgi:hypothetical protein
VLPPMRNCVPLVSERHHLIAGTSVNAALSSVASWSCPYKTGHAAVGELARMNSLGERMPSRL